MQPNNFAILTAAVRFSKKLTDRQKLLCAEISALTNAKGYCWASNARLGELYGRSPETISRDIKQIEEAGFIRCEYMKDNSRYIYLLTEKTILIDETIKTSCRNDQDPIDETVKHNNINNKIINKDIERQIVKYFIENVNGKYEALPGPDTYDNIKAILRKATPEQLKKVIDKKAAQFHAGEIDARVFNMKWLLRPDNFFTQLSIIENPVQKKNDKFKGKTKGAKVATKEQWEEAAQKYKDGWR